MTLVQWLLMFVGAALVLVYIVAIQLTDPSKSGAWSQTVPTVCLLAGNGVLIAGGLIDAWPRRPLAISSAKWRFRLSGLLALLGTGAVVALPMLALVELYIAKIVSVLLHR